MRPIAEQRRQVRRDHNVAAGYRPREHVDLAEPLALGADNVPIKSAAPHGAVQRIIVAFLGVHLDARVAECLRGGGSAPSARRSDVWGRHRDHRRVVDVQVGHQSHALPRLAAHARAAARRHQIIDGKRARITQDRASDGFRDVGRVVVALHQTEEARL